MESVRRAVLVLVFAIIGSGLSPNLAKAQSTEEKFHDLFVTAGYCTAFGAALGTAVLGLTDNPSEKLQYVAVGASLGFIGGSVMGSYIIFSPGFVENEDDGAAEGLIAQSSMPIPEGRLALRPTWNRESKSVTSVEGAMTLFTF